MNELFETVKIGALELPNRLVMAPMTRSRAEHEGEVTELTARYYAQRASAGLIITEGTQPNRVGQGYVWTPGLHTPGQVAAWRKVTDAVHSADGRIFAQLMHTGRIGHPSLHGQTPLAPSAVASGEQLFSPEGMLDHPEPRAMTLDEITQTIEDFTNAARNAVDAGFDGIELHGANGYLIHQFLADGTNHRTDAYGGSIENRIRFAVELTRAVADAIGADRVGIRISPGNTFNGISESDSADLYSALLRELAPFGLAYVHVMEVVTRDITRKLRAQWPGKLILNPHPTPDSFPSSPQDGVDAVREGLADAVAFGELWLANPDLPTRIKAGGPYTKGDKSTFYGGTEKGYTDYPPLP